MRDFGQLLDRKILFFGGKGGVGKTTSASATALAASQTGRRVLLVSTDPAHNTSDILGRPIGPDIVEVRDNLHALEIDAAQESARYVEEVKGRIKDLFGHGILKEANRQIDLAASMPAAEEVALFDRIGSLIRGEDDRFDLLVFDTAPDRAHAAADSDAGADGGVDSRAVAIAAGDARRRRRTTATIRSCARWPSGSSGCGSFAPAWSARASPRSSWCSSPNGCRSRKRRGRWRSSKRRASASVRSSSTACCRRAAPIRSWWRGRRRNVYISTRSTADSRPCRGCGCRSSHGTCTASTPCRPSPGRCFPRNGRARERTIMIARPTADEFASFYAGYIGKVPACRGPSPRSRRSAHAIEALASLPDEKATYRYADGKWSVKEVLGHLADAERVFWLSPPAHRPCRHHAAGRLRRERSGPPSRPTTRRPIGRGGAGAARGSRSDPGAGRSLDEAALDRQTVANGKPVSGRALCWILAGHTQHHLQVLYERYGVRGESGDFTDLVMS